MKIASSVVMPWWTTLVLLALGAYLWLAGRANPDDVIGLLEQMLAIVLGLVVLFVGRSMVLESLVLLVALRLPTARPSRAVARHSARKDILMPF